MDAGLAVPARALDEASAVLDDVILPALGAPVSTWSRDRLALDRRPSGSFVVFTVHGSRRERILEIDRAGALATVLRWERAALAEASVRTPDGRWVTIEPRADRDAGSAADRLWLGERPGRSGAVALADFPAVDYAAVTDIPVLADPSRVPPGAGTAILNLFASLAGDQQRRALRYAGPYPTEQLFLALLESFRYVEAGDTADPLGAFMRGDLEWDPAPHERWLEADGLVVQVRDRVEKVVWDARTYYRADWQGVARHAPRRVRDDADGVLCSLWALGAPVDDHLRMNADGRLIAIVAPASPSSDFTRPLPDAVTQGVVATVAATCVPALAPSVRTAARGLTFSWTPLHRDLVRASGETIDLSTRLRALARERLSAAIDRRARVSLAFALLAEIASLAGDALRARAQADLATRPLDEQQALLALEEDPERGSVAGLVAGAVEALLAELTSG